MAGLWSSSVRSDRREEIVLARLRLGHNVLTHSCIIDQLPPPLFHYVSVLRLCLMFCWLVIGIEDDGSSWNFNVEL